MSLLCYITKSLIVYAQSVFYCVSNIKNQIVCQNVEQSIVLVNQLWIEPGVDKASCG